MKIGFIGAGNIGSVIAGNLVKAGHEVRLANSRGIEAVRPIADSMGAIASNTDDVVSEAEAVIISLPFLATLGLRGLLKIVPASVPIIDTSNYFPFRDGSIEAIDKGQPESIWMSESLERDVVKAWNGVLPDTLIDKALPKGEVGRLALPVAGNDDAHKKMALQLIDDTGFDPVDAGRLADSWRMQPGTPGYCTELDRESLEAALAAADRDQAVRNRETVVAELLKLKEPPSSEWFVGHFRQLNATFFGERPHQA